MKIRLESGRILDIEPRKTCLMCGGTGLEQMSNDPEEPSNNLYQRCDCVTKQVAKESAKSESFIL